MGRQQLLYQYPPDLQKAERHRLANRIFKGIQKDPTCPQCDCCDRKVGVEEVQTNCCYDKSQLAFLGPGVPLFFAYLRNCIILLITFTVVFSGYCIYSNISESNCSMQSANCQHNIFNTISFANKMNNTDLLSIQNYIVLTFVVINILLFHYFRYNFRQIQQQCDDIVNSPSDYAIILRRLPEDITKEDLELMVEKRRTQLTQEERNKTENLKIDHMVLSYYMGEYTRIKNQNLDKLKQLIDEDKVSQFKPQPFPPLNQTAKIAIIIFSRQESKDFFLYKPSFFQKFVHFFCDPCTPLSNFEVKGQRVSIQRAPQPDDVVWQNSKISIKGAIVRKTIFNILGALLLFSGGFAQYWLAVLQLSVTDKTIQQLLSVGLSILVAVFNFLILQFLVITTVKERNETLTEFNTVLTVKISFFQFLNTGIFVVLANFLADINHFTITQSLPSDITIVMVTNAITPNFSLLLLNYFEIIGKVMRWLVKNEKMKVTQIQANKLWQGPQAEIPYKYGYVLKTLWLTAFYAPLVPVVVPISIIGLVLNYFIEKDLYRKIYNVPNMLSSMVNDSAIELLEYFPLIISLGEFIVYIYVSRYDVTSIPQNWSIPIYISIGLSLLNLLLPMEQINKKIIKLKNDDLVSPPYEQVESKFQVTYEMTNPAYQCKKKRKRDVFLFNHIFGGDAKNVALNMSGFLGLNETDRSMMKDPLINKNPNQAGNNILSGLNSDQPAVKTNQTNTKTEENNPFAAFMKMNTMGKENNNTTQNNKVAQSAIDDNKKPINIFAQPNNPEDSKKVNENSSVMNQNNTKPTTVSQPIISNIQQTTNPNVQNTTNPMAQNSTIPPNLNNQPSTSTGLVSDYKSITKDLKFKYNNSNTNQAQPVQYINPLSEISSDEKYVLANNELSSPQVKKTNSNEVSTTKTADEKNINIPQKKEPSFFHLLSAVKEKEMNSNSKQRISYITPIDTKEIKQQSKSNKNTNEVDKINSPTRKKGKQTDQQNLDFLNNFPNLQQQRKISQQTKERFIQQSPKDINYGNKRLTNSGTVFVQKPQEKSLNKFPHVQIHVPGMKPKTYKDPNLEKPATKSPTKTNKQYDDHIEMMNLKPQQFSKNNEFKLDQIYNPRFSQRQPVDINKMYGPPKGYGVNDSYQKLTKDFNSHFS